MVFKSVFKEVERDLELCKVQKIGKKGINLSNNYFIVSFFAVRKYKWSELKWYCPVLGFSPCGNSTHILFTV